MRRILSALAAALLVVAACTPPPVPDQLDWCYEFDFQESDYSAEGVNIQEGVWIDGQGISSYEDGLLAFSYTSAYTVEPLYATVSVIRAPDAGDMDIISNSSIFGIDASFNELWPAAAPQTLTLSFAPEVANQIGGTLSVDVEATNYVAIQSIKVSGIGANPFPLNSCGGTPTPTSAPDTATSTPVTYTPTFTHTPTETPTPTETHTFTHTFTPTTCSLSYSHDFRDAESDMVTVLPYWQWDNIALGLGFDTLGSYEAGEGYRYSERRYGAYGGGAKGWERGLRIRVDFPVPMPLQSFLMTTHAHGTHSLTLYATDDTSVAASHGDPYERDFGWASGLTKEYTHAIYSGFEGDYEIGWVRGMSYTLRGCQPTPTPSNTPTASETGTPSRTPVTRTPGPTSTASRTPLLIQSPTASLVNPSLTPVTPGATPTPLPTTSLVPLPTWLPTIVPSDDPVDGTWDDAVGEWSDCASSIEMENDFLGLGTFLAQFWNCTVMPVVINIQNALAGLFDWIGNTATKFFEWLGSMLGWLAGTLNNFGFSVGGAFQVLLDLFALIGRFITEIFDIVGLLLSIIRHLLELFIGWIEQFIELIQTILYDWYLTTPKPIPYLPQCLTNPTASDVCAVYYILENTLLAGTVGGLLIPFIVIVIDLAILMRFIITVRNLINKGEGITS